MKKFWWLLAAFFICFQGCAKDDKGCTSVKPEAEEASIMSFASANGISVTRHTKGIYYQILKPGSGKTPTAKSAVTVKYVGKLLNGSVFSESNYYTRFLPDVIEGWQLGIPLIKEGGSIKLIIPSVYAYGCNGTKDIPSDAVLYFEVELLRVE